MRPIVLALLTCLGLLPAPVSAQQGAAEEVDLELVLLADATGSIDEGEIQLQRQGYAAAMTHPQVLGAIAQGLTGRIAVTYVEWADMLSQDVVVDWMVVDGPDTAALFAERIMTPPRRAFGRNAIGAALIKGLDLIETNGFEGLRKVIDFSADSANSWNGPGIAEARAQVLSADIVINGLAVLCRTCSGRPAGYDLEAAFEATIIGGPGAFVITADSLTTFAEAVRRKLILEIAGQTPAGAVASR